MLRMKRISEMYDMKVFTENGDFVGLVEESIISSTTITGWKVIATKDSLIQKSLGKVKGIIVPHNMIYTIGDIMIISQNIIRVEEE